MCGSQHGSVKIIRDKNACARAAHLLHVRAVVLQDVDRVLGDENLVVAHVRKQRLSQVVAVRLDDLHWLLGLQICPRLLSRVRRSRRAVLLAIDEAGHRRSLLHPYVRRRRTRPAEAERVAEGGSADGEHFFPTLTAPSHVDARGRLRADVPRRDTRALGTLPMEYKAP